MFYIIIIIIHIIVPKLTKLLSKKLDFSILLISDVKAKNSGQDNVRGRQLELGHIAPCMSFIERHNRQQHQRFVFIYTCADA